MQLKELTVKELLALFDASTHEQIVEYYEDASVHYIVIFANHFQPDMGLLTVGPAQDCTSLEQAKRAIIDRKFAKYVVKCRHCPPEKKKEDTVFGGLVKPLDKSATLESVAPVAKAPAPVPPAAAAKPGLALPSPAAKSAAPAPVAAAQPAPVARPEAAPAPAPAPALSADVLAEVKAREEAVAKKEAALKVIEDELKQREDELVDREEYVTNSEESLIEKIQKQERRTAEMEQQEENIKKRLEEIARREAKIADFNAKNPAAAV